MLGPTLYALLMDRASTEPRTVIKDALETESRGFAARLAPALEGALRDAYTTGVRDGFAQGVQAATDEAAASEHGR